MADVFPARGHGARLRAAGFPPGLNRILFVRRRRVLDYRFWSVERRSVDNSHVSDEAVTAASYRLNKTRILRRIAQRLTDFIDRFVESVVEVHDSVGGPKFRLEFLTRYHLAHALEQHRQDLKRLLLQFDLQAFPAQFARSKINLESPEADLRGWHWLSCRPALEGITLLAGK